MCRKNKLSFIILNLLVIADVISSLCSFTIRSASSSSYINSHHIVSTSHDHHVIALQSTINIEENNINNEFPSEKSSTYVRCSKCQTVYSFTENDFEPGNNGRRLECSVCGHTWYQSKDRLAAIQDDFELVTLPERDLDRIKTNIIEGKSPKFLGDKKLYVGNISFECHEDDIYKVFSTIGNVGDVSFVRDETGRCRGFGFVTMRNTEDAAKAVEQLDGMSIRGRNIAVRESNN
jgi:predicted Zn finger-like uncharacterized protein